MKPPSSRDEQLFADALARPDGERAAFLDGACGGDGTLKERILALLKAHAGPESLLAGAPVAVEVMRPEQAVPLSASNAECMNPSRHRDEQLFADALMRSEQDRDIVGIGYPVGRYRNTLPHRIRDFSPTADGGNCGANPRLRARTSSSELRFPI
jgi:hypothetical protein